ncbi:hypothetical protein GH714_013953 [Hevea brasiliensis]|uniref:Uncharacterized protein n=1 Tax=Hevea brasiliensis TaxID=3981 RepID=A0A6A6LC04_HEVBR|nr:hypothetical protein GH714_013953 [Hevea brasiliensis]
MILHHEERFIENNGEVMYEGRDLFIVDNFDTDYISYWDIKETFNECLKYPSVIKMWIAKPLKSLKEGLILLNDDSAIMHIRKYIGNIKKIHIYSKHHLDRLYLSYEFPILPSIISNLDAGPSVDNENLGFSESEGARTWGRRVEHPIGFDTFYGTQGSEVNIEKSNGNLFKDTDTTEVGGSVGVEERTVGVEDNIVVNNEATLCDKRVAERKKATKRKGKKVKVDSSSNESKKSIGEEINDEYEEDESSRTNSEDGRDEFVRRKSKRAKYDSEAQLPCFSLGMEISNAIEFKNAIAKYSVARGVKIRKNKEDTLVVKTFNGSHKCYRVFKNPRVSSEYLANHFKARIYQNVNTKARELKHFAKVELRVHVTYSKLEKDGKNHMFPIAWAVCLSEDKDNWRWFLQWLMLQLELGDGSRIIVASDIQKGLIPAIQEVLPKAEHRYFARHIYANWHKRWMGGEIKKKFFSCAWIYYEEEFKDNLKRLAAHGKQCVEDLLYYPPQNWDNFVGSNVEQEIPPATSSHPLPVGYLGIANGTLGGSSRRPSSSGGNCDITFMFENNCQETLWFASSPSDGDLDPENGPDTLEIFSMPDPWSGSIWVRTKCTTNLTGYFSCETGDWVRHNRLPGSTTHIPSH